MIDEADIMNQYTADEYWGRRGRVGIVPLINNQAYWFITINANEKILNMYHLKTTFAGLF